MAVTHIERKVKPIILNYDISVVDTEKTKVAAYARVSTDREEQEDSFERQVSYYTGYIKNRLDWQFVGIYADPGITGTQADKRIDFMRMIEDCKQGKIQKILCKSIPRFARNTVDLLSYVRQLRDLGIGVYFENENIDTLDTAGEILLTVLAATAENESRSISSNVKWTLEKKFESGDMMLNYTRFLGYTRDQDHNLVIVEEEAEIIRRIFREYLCGYSAKQIANKLTEDKIPTPSNRTRWSDNVIYSILKNEKYYGCAILGKTMKKDVVSKKRIKNDGTQKMFIVEDSHPAIITKEVFDAVQAESAKRTQYRSTTPTKNGKYSHKYPFSKMIKCGSCGSFYRRYAQVLKGGYQPVWVCIAMKTSTELCKQNFIKESSLKKAFVRAVKELVVEIDSIKDTLRNNISTVLIDENTKALNQNELDIEALQNEMMTLHKNKSDGKIKEVEYQQRGIIIQGKINLLREKAEMIEEQINKASLDKYKAQKVLGELDKMMNLEEFDEELFRSLVEEITIRNRYDVEFTFKIGISIEVRAEA